MISSMGFSPMTNCYMPTQRVQQAYQPRPPKPSRPLPHARQERFGKVDDSWAYARVHTRQNSLVNRTLAEHRNPEKPSKPTVKRFPFGFFDAVINFFVNLAHYLFGFRREQDLYATNHDMYDFRAKELENPSDFAVLYNKNYTRSFLNSRDTFEEWFNKHKEPGREFMDPIKDNFKNHKFATIGLNY